MERGRGRKFQRKTEDFTCSNCGNIVIGNGYTNHCPKCLWSKHVDLAPGDRLASCGGMMKPMGVEKVSREFVLIQQCIKCGHVRKNKTVGEDNFDEIVKLSTNILD